MLSLARSLLFVDPALRLVDLLIDSLFTDPTLLLLFADPTLPLVDLLTALLLFVDATTLSVDMMMALLFDGATSLFNGLLVGIAEFRMLLLLDATTLRASFTPLRAVGLLSVLLAVDAALRAIGLLSMLLAVDTALLRAKFLPLPIAVKAVAEPGASAAVFAFDPRKGGKPNPSGCKFRVAPRPCNGR